VSGVYSSWYYLPENYSVPGDSWVNIFQFKEQYRTPAGGHSDPLWWVQLGGAAWASSMSQAYGEGAIGGRPDAPVAFIDYWYNNWRETRKFVPVPLGRWFELKAVLRQNDRIDFFIDGKPLDTAKASTYPVSPFHGDQSMEWIFGVGNYSTAANGPLYADRVSYTGF
jgi:beta-glucanase (GH16 family)